MTVVNQHPQSEPHTEPVGRADLARTDAHRVAALIQIARDGHAEARDSGDEAERLRHAVDSLYDRIASKVGDRRTRLDRALHGLDGSLDETAVLEYLDLTGRERMTARQALQRILDRRTLPEFDSGQDVSDRLHKLAHSWERETRVHEAAPTSRPALPAAGVAPVAAPPLPHREPIAPSQPPMYPAAPPEAPAQSTGQMTAILLDGTAGGAQKTLSAQSLQMLQDNGFGPQPEQVAAPVAPSPAGFTPTALPQPRPVRAGDTQRMTPVRPDANEVLAELAMPDASAGERKEPGVRPFVAAAVGNGGASSPAATGAGSGDGDD